MKTNLLYVITKLELGGAQKHVLDLAHLADKRRFNVFLLTAQEGLLVKEASSLSGVQVHLSRFLERAINPFFDLLAFFEIFFFIRKNRIALVHTHSSKAGILGRWAGWLAGVKVVHTVHGWSFNLYQPLVERNFFAWLERVTARLTHKLIVVSSWDKALGLRLRIGKEGQYAVIPCGIDVDAFSGKKAKGSLREDLGLDERDLVVGSMGCFKKQKAPQDFMKLAGLVKESVPGVKFLLAGDGELRGDVCVLRQRLGLSQDVYLLGWQKDIPRFLESLDVFVLTSLWEGLPLSVLEALASSKPVLVTDTGGVRDIVQEGQTGYLAPVRDLVSMKEKLVMLLNDAERRQQCGDAGRRSLSDKHRVATMAKNIFSVYEGLVVRKDISGAP
jgi:glycosyltransferase involved in cell wall biosynthesis